MTDCEHCSESFEDEAGYLRHLDDEHPGEMGPIERRKLDELGGSGGGPSMPLLVGGIAVVALLLAVVLYTLTTGGSGANSDLGELGPAPDPPGHELGPAGEDEAYQPYRVGAFDRHGEIDVTVAGNGIDFGEAQFQHPRKMGAFHFEGGQSQWHMHAKGVTLEYALEATAFGVTNDSFAYDDVVYYEGTAGSSPDGWTVVTNATIEYRVNGEPVAPETYVIEQDDTIVVTVQSPDSSDDGTNGTTNATVAATA